MSGSGLGLWLKLVFLVKNSIPLLSLGYGWESSSANPGSCREVRKKEFFA